MGAPPRQHHATVGFNVGYSAAELATMYTVLGAVIGPLAKYHPQNCALINALVTQIPHGET